MAIDVICKARRFKNPKTGDFYSTLVKGTSLAN